MAKRSILPSKAEINALLLYNPDTGIFTWKVSPNSNVPAGRVAGTKRGAGYWAIRMNGGAYQAHRLAWVVMTGEPPSHDIDHINGIRDDNRWANLRSATMSQNCANSTKQRNNCTGYKGVSTLTHSPNRWQAQIHINGKNNYLGIFTSPELAHEAYMKAAREAHGEFATDGNRSTDPQNFPPESGER